MCGFLGEFCDKEKKQLTTVNVFSELLELSKHRGPDATESARAEYFQLGFNRLAILDLSSNGNQPKSSPSGRYQVVFNGEIYNYLDLVKIHQLENLNSTSDTEVLVHLIDHLGVEEAIKSLNGMFAIAIVDTDDKRLYLTRDFAGIKPHFYGVAEQGVVFASQFDQIHKHPWFKSNLECRPEIMKEYFGFGYMQSPNTIFKSIFQVNPGELIVFGASEKTRKKQLVTFPKSVKAKYKENKETSKQYNKLLENIVNRQLHSDVPIASFLSGGIDSPLIVAHAKKHKENLQAFTLKVSDKQLNESEIAKEYAKALSVKQQIIDVKPTDFLELIDEYFETCPEPFGDYSSLPTFLLAKHAVKDHKVMLSGDGGDELFYGYPRFLHITQNKSWFSIPFKIRKPLVTLSNKLNWSNTPAPYYYTTISQWQMAKNLYVFPDILDKLVPKTTFSSELKKLYDLEDAHSKKSLLKALRHNEFYAHLQRVLVKVDRASMANSLEVRVPFLDKESIDFSWQLDTDLLKHKTFKKVLKDCLSHFIPKALINKRKMGFTIPLDNWLQNELKEDVMFHVFEIPIYGEEFLNTDYLKLAVSNYYQSKGPFSGWAVWHIYAWQKWALKHVIA